VLSPGERFQFKTHIVKKGDSFQKIARLYRVDQEPILEINRLNKKSPLSTGMNLLIPLPKDQDAKPDNIAKKKSEGVSPPLKPSTEMTYTIKKGDSLWTIANETGVNIGSLSRWNNLHPEQKLMPGDKLKIRVNKPSGSLDEPHGKKAGREIIYIVKEGDTLWSIAKKFNLTVSEIKTWNHLNETDRIHPDDRLKLRVGRVKSSTLN
jgi:membrane-bound lytic murein transglycosylase D